MDVARPPAVPLGLVVPADSPAAPADRAGQVVDPVAPPAAADPEVAAATAAAPVGPAAVTAADRVGDRAAARVAVPVGREVPEGVAGPVWVEGDPTSAVPAVGAATSRSSSRPS